MSDKIPCKHREHDAEHLNCRTCQHNLGFSIRSFDEIDSLVAQITDIIFSSAEMAWDTEKIRFLVNLVINEAIPNAVEHGILGTDFHEKRDAVNESDDKYLENIQAKWKEKGVPVEISLCINLGRVLLAFHDGGKGFDPSMHERDLLQEDNILESSGRGIAMMKQFGIQLHWNKEGNSVLCAIMDEHLRASKNPVKLDEIFCVGIEEFDNQHAKLFGLFNVLFQNLLEKHSKELTGRSLTNLLDYCIVHFAAEEELLKQHGYPDYENHKREHEDLALRIQQIHERFMSGDDLLTSEILGFLVSWLKNHIAKVDKLYAPFLNSKGLS